MFDKKKIETMLIDFISDAYVPFDANEKVGITEKTRPVTDLVGFDSLNFIEVSLQLSEALGEEIPLSIFVDRIESNPLSVEEIAEKIFLELEKKNETSRN